jgi:hypothetical protein
MARALFLRRSLRGWSPRRHDRQDAPIAKLRAGSRHHGFFVVCGRIGSVVPTRGAEPLIAAMLKTVSQ